MQGDNGFYMLLDRTFSAAGLPNPDNRSNCIVSMFEPRQSNQQAPNQQPVQGVSPDSDATIPF